MAEPKHYLLDTSCLIDDPRAVLALGTGGNHVYVHEVVLQELDKIKNDYKEEPFVRGNAKEALHVIRDLLFSTDNAKEPIKYNEGNALFHAVTGRKGVRYTHGDPALLDFLEDSYSNGSSMVLVSEDTGLLSMALTRGYKAEVRRDARKGKSLHEIFNLEEEIDLPPEKREELRRTRNTRLEAGEMDVLSRLFQNQYLFITGERMSVRHKKEGNAHVFSKLSDRSEAKGIRPRNKEQGYLLDLALDPNITIGSVIGMAGTGKTLVLLAAALQQVEENRYKNVTIIRPLSTVGEGVGYLPGDLGEKLAPFMLPIGDAIEVIERQGSSRQREEKDQFGFGLQGYIQEGLIEIMSPTFARGRNLTNSYVIVDEAQNLNQVEIKTLATRCGVDSKIIFNGDPYQIDARYLDQEKNGLVYLTKRLLDDPLFSAVILKKGERSPAAELAARLL